jgi:hypothetical protein
VAALIGFLIGYAICYRIAPGRAQPAREHFFARRVAVAAGALSFYFGDRLLYQIGIHGLPRKCGAVILATAVLAAGFWWTENDSVN